MISLEDAKSVAGYVDIVLIIVMLFIGVGMGHLIDVKYVAADCNKAMIQNCRHDIGWLMPNMSINDVEKIQSIIKNNRGGVEDASN